MSKATINEEINLNEIYKAIKNCDDFRINIKKIKMKQDYYDKLATEVQRNVAIIEVRDVNMQPLNTLYGLKVEIDNGISKDWEVVYE